jgi:uncharacterized protein
MPNRRQFVRTTSAAMGAAILSSNSEAAGAEPAEIWDAHDHLGRNNVSPKQHVADLIRVGGRLGITKFTIAMGLTPHLKSPKPAEFRQKNDDMMAALDAFPNQTIGLVFINPLHLPESLAEIDRCMKHPRVIGLKLWIACRCNDPRLDPIVERANRHHATIHQHVWDKTTPKTDGESLPEDLAELAARHRKTQFIAMHSGGNWERGIRALRGSPNVSAELSGSEPVAGYIDMAVRELGDQRIIWGSDAPGRSFASQLAKVYEAELSTTARRRILAGNYRRQVERALAHKKAR